MSASALQLITASFTELNVFLPGESIPNDQAQTALGYLNRMMSSWAQSTQMMPVVAREVFTTTANKGGPGNPYTIGIGGDFNTDKPPNQQSIAGAGLNLNSSSPVVEIPRALLTDDMWQATQVKDLSNLLWTSVYYNPTYTTGLGTINLWPVPTVGDNDLVLYLRKYLSQFADLNTSYTFPDGVEEMLVYNLATRLVTPFGGQLQPATAKFATETLRVFKRANLKLADMPNDLVWSPKRRGWNYNIQTGQGG
jgi:hypothetical protein